MEKLIAVEAQLGYQNQQLREFVKEQQTLEREERHEEERKKELKEAEVQRAREARKAERANREAERAASEVEAQCESSQES